MSQRGKFIAWLAALYAAVLAVPVLVGALLASGLPEADAEALGRILELRTPALALAAVLLLLLCAGLVRWFFADYVAPARALAEQTRVIRSANAELRLPSDAAGGLGALAAAINELGDAYRILQRDSEARAAEARARLEEERNRLAALMSELTQGVLVCNAEGTILLYNEAARTLFSSPQAAGAHPLVGLGRSVFALLDRGQIAHAAQKLQRSVERGERLPSARFVAATLAGRLLKAQVAPFLGAEARLAGMVLALEDVTELLDRESQRRSLLQTFAARIRAPAANIRAVAENLAAFPEIDPQRRARFIGIVAAESAGLSAIINDALREYADALKAALRLEDMRAADLLEFARLRVAGALAVGVEIAEAGDEVWVRVDSYALVQAMVHLAARLREEQGVREFELRARGVGRYAEIDLAWSGAIVASDALSLWEMQPMEAGAEQSPLTVRDVLEQHGGEVWYRRSGVAGLRTGCFRFLIPGGEPPVPLRASRIAQSRPEYYDFDLFGRGAVAGTLNEAKLASLSYTVFDTETTGLEPSAGDEIISIGAVRLVNGRLLRNEVFEQLVNPCRPLNPASARVHGIEAQALVGQPTIAEVLPAFHRFCEDTVLVAHNAAFDMRFLEIKRAATGVHFAQPVLDTLLLSALAHPGLHDQRLEAIAERLGVDLIGRHTALGDALLAGEIFLKLLPLLAERGIVTLGQALEASRETYYARLQY
ncbi:MAG TPA: exonuclease domain-containing protein [Burkholderiales bacterium]